MERRQGIKNEAMSLVQEHYSRFYRTGGKEDSPDASRDNLRRKLKMMAHHLDSDDIVLDLGSGRQIFERAYRHAYGEPNFKFLTVDFAKVRQSELLTKGSEAHIRASGCNLPLPDKSVSVIVSSMALDFMPKEAINEVARVMKADARALVTLHHKDLITDKLNEIENKRRLRKGAQNVKAFFEHLRDNNVLFESQDEIRSTFENCGLIISDLRLTRDRWDQWWELDLLKKSKSFEEAEQTAWGRDNKLSLVDWMNA